MSSTLAPDQALARVQVLAECEYTWTPLAGGLSNRSFLIETPDERYVLRLDATHTPPFHLDRHTEQRVLKQAAAAGLAPTTIYADPERGILLSRYVEGRVLAPLDLADEQCLTAVGQLVCRVHSLPACGKAFDAVKISRRYRQGLASATMGLPIVARCLNIIARFASPTDTVCCHNDIVAANVLATPELMLLDWEYAADNDAYFDLGGIVAYHELGETAARMLLRAYGDQDSGRNLRRLREQMQVYNALHWLWLALRERDNSSADSAARLRALEQRLG